VHSSHGNQAKKNGRKTIKENKAVTKESYKQLGQLSERILKKSKLQKKQLNPSTIAAITTKSTYTYNNCKRTKFIFCHYSNCFCPFTF